MHSGTLYNSDVIVTLYTLYSNTLYMYMVTLCMVHSGTEHETVYNSVVTLCTLYSVTVCTCIYVPLCAGRSKGKAGT